MNEIDLALEPVTRERIFTLRVQLAAYDRVQLEDAIITLCVRHQLWDEVSALTPAKTPPPVEPEETLDDAERVVTDAERKLEDSPP